MKYLTLSMAITLFGICAGPGTGQDLRIAVVDMTALFEAHPDAAAAQTRVEEQRKQARERLQEQSAKLKSTLDSYNKIAAEIRRSGASAKAEAKEEADDLAARARQLEREVAEAESTSATRLENAVIVERQKILAKISAAIKAFNAEQAYHLIVDKSATSAAGLPMIADVRGLPDITAAVTRTFSK